MEIYAARYDPHAFDIDRLFWGALIFLAVFVCCFLVWKAIERPHNGRKFDGVGAVDQQRVSATPAERITAKSRPVTKPHRRLTEFVDGDTVEGGHIKDPEDDPLVASVLDSRPWRRVADDESTDMAGFSEREEEEFLLTYGPRKVRKAIRERRNARLSNSQKKQSQS